MKDQRRVLPTIAYLEGEYGHEGIYLGVPTIIGGNGLEQIIELELTDYEKAQLSKSVESVKNVMKYCHKKKGKASESEAFLFLQLMKAFSFSLSDPFSENDQKGELSERAVLDKMKS